MTCGKEMIDNAGARGPLGVSPAACRVLSATCAGSTASRMRRANIPCNTDNVETCIKEFDAFSKPRTPPRFIIKSLG